MKMAVSSMGQDSQPQVKSGWGRLAFVMDFTSVIVSDLSRGEKLLTPCGHELRVVLQMVQQPSALQQGISGALANEIIHGGG